MNPIHLAVIGTGLIGQKHLALVAANAACTVVAICDSNPAAATLAVQYGARFYSDYDALLAKEALDGVIIATPTHLHTPVGIACAKRGIHLFIEKPIAATRAEAEALIEVVDAHGVQVLVGHHRRHNPLVQAARALVQTGELGKLVAVSAFFTLRKPDEYFAVAWRTLRPGGGPTLINLIHDVDNLRYICGEITQVYAQTSSAVRGLAVEDALSATLTFANGALGTILAADSTPAPWSYELTTGENPAYPQVRENCYYLCGTAGALAFPQMLRWHYPQPAHAGWLDPLEATHHPVVATDPLVTQLDHFCRVIRGEESPLCSGREATQSLAVALALLESAQTGRSIAL